jgi:TRAP-type C4-dicarboxylate transport system permease small subunit
MMPPSRWVQLDRGLAAALRDACTATFVVLVALVTALILVRFVPMVPLGWAEEIVEMAFAYTVFLGAALLWRNGQHFQVDLLPTMLRGTRAGRVLEIALNLISLGFFLVFTYQAAVYTYRTVVPSAILAWPKSLWYMSMPISGAIIVGYTVRDLCRLLRGEPLPGKGGEAAG